MDDADRDDDDDNGAALTTIEFMICLEMWILIVAIFHPTMSLSPFSCTSFPKGGFDGDLKGWLEMCVKCSNIPLNKFVCQCQQSAGSDKNDGKWGKTESKEGDLSFCLKFCSAINTNLFLCGQIAAALHSVFFLFLFKLL